MHCPCPHRCSCHSAGPSTLPPPTSAPRTPSTATPSTWNRTAPVLLLAALAAPAFAAPAPLPRPDLAFLYPTLARRVTDAGQAPDDTSSGWFTPQNVEVEDLISAGLSIKFVYDPTASPDEPSSAGAVEQEFRGNAGAWVVDDYWELHGKRFGPHTATATADITDNPLPTTTESASSATPTPTVTPTTSAVPSLLAIESSLPTGWNDPQYRSSGIYRIPIVVSFAVVIALMIGALIGALVYRRSKRRRRRRQKDKRATGADNGDTDSEPSLREKATRKTLSARVGRVLRAVHNSELRRRNTPRPDTRPTEPAPAPAPADAEQGEEEVERARETSERNDLERRVKSWARRGALWRVQARVGMRRRIPAQRRGTDAADNDDNNEAAARSRTNIRPASPVPSAPPPRTSGEETRVPVVVVTDADQEAAGTTTDTTPTVPTYSSVSGSGSQPGSSTSTTVTPSTSHDAHPDATPGDEPAYEYGSGLPPAYRRGEGMTEVRRGKMPMREASVEESGAEGEGRETAYAERREEAQREESRGAWTTLDAYAFLREQEAKVGVTAHVATDDKQVLERLRRMRGAPGQDSEVQEAGEAPREEDVFGVEIEGQEALAAGGSQMFPPPPDSQTRVLPRHDESALPSPPAKTGAGPVARYGEADLSLPGYLDGEAASTLGPSAPPDEDDRGDGSHDGPSAPPDELGPSAHPDEIGPSAPPLEVDDEQLVPGPSALPEPELLKPSAPPLEEEDAHPLATPKLRYINSASPLLEDEHR
ncbi:hypothetical protein FRC10_009687 [Ceratobasidium sp. 414]|nr:hypothetical protein FRC10_009687 [Ceratobasidium sp. 414]